MIQTMAKKVDVIFNSEKDQYKGYFQIASGFISQTAIQFPIYKWIDNYPHCDGEHDRWDKIIIGSYKLMYDMDAKIVSCVKG